MSHASVLVVIVVKGIVHPSLPEILFYVAEEEQAARDVCDDMNFSDVLGWELMLSDPRSFQSRYPWFLQRKAVSLAFFLGGENLGDMGWVDQPFPEIREFLNRIALDISKSHMLQGEEGPVEVPWFLVHEKSERSRQA